MRSVLELAAELADRTDQRDFRRTALDSLTTMLPCDLGIWTSLDLAAGAVQVDSGRDTDDAFLVELLRETSIDDPVVRSYLTNPVDQSPRRVSDVISAADWRRTRHATEVAPHLGGPFQLSVVVRLSLDGRGAGFILGRTGTDFSDADVEVASRLLPTLIALDRMFERHDLASRSRSNSRVGDGCESTSPMSADSIGRLTPREQEVLRLLAMGLTAHQMARRCETRPATIRKHLERIYAKLDCHDRLLAVERARAMGLLDTPTF